MYILAPYRDYYIRQRLAAGCAIYSLGNIGGQIRLRIKAAAPCLFGRDDEVISVGITVGALQDDMKGATQHPIRGNFIDAQAL
jgi:hypothetical protein